MNEEVNESGLGRVGFIVIEAILVAILFGSSMIGYVEGSQWVFFGGIFLSLVGTMVIAWFRLLSIGYSPWLTFISLIPMASGIFIIFLSAIPAGFSSHKKLDKYAYIIVCVLIMLMVIIPILLKLA